MQLRALLPAPLLAACVLALVAPAGAYWTPPARPTFYWQLQGRLVTSVPASVYDVDGFATTASEVAALHGGASESSATST
jgi:hypothetical protein